MALQWLEQIMSSNIVFQCCPLHSALKIKNKIENNHECSSCGQLPAKLFYLSSRLSLLDEAVYNLSERLFSDRYGVPLILCDECEKKTRHCLREDAAVSNFLILDFEPLQVVIKKERYLVITISSIVSHYLFHGVVKCPFH